MFYIIGLNILPDKILFQCIMHPFQWISTNNVQKKKSIQGLHKNNTINSSFYKYILFVDYEKKRKLLNIIKNITLQ